MKVINLYGAPGSGKSTMAAGLFSYYKAKGFNVELVREFIKDKIYEGGERILANQVFITATQYKLMKDIEGYKEVPLIITDCPLILGSFYNREIQYHDELTKLIQRLVLQFENINIFVKRVKPYVESGRLHDEQESDKISETMFECYSPYDYIVDGDSESALTLAQELEPLLK